MFFLAFNISTVFAKKRPECLRFCFVWSILFISLSVASHWNYDLNYYKGVLGWNESTLCLLYLCVSHKNSGRQRFSRRPRPPRTKRSSRISWACWPCRPKGQPTPRGCFHLTLHLKCDVRGQHWLIACRLWWITLCAVPRQIVLILYLTGSLRLIIVSCLWQGNIGPDGPPGLKGNPVIQLYFSSLCVFWCL